MPKKSGPQRGAARQAVLADSEAAQLLGEGCLLPDDETTTRLQELQHLQHGILVEQCLIEEGSRSVGRKSQRFTMRGHRVVNLNHQLRYVPDCSKALAKLTHLHVNLSL